MLSQFTRLPVRQMLAQVLNFALIVCTAFSLWKSLALYTDSPAPIVVVLSGSMEPAFHRGDLLVLNNRKKAVDVGDVVVYNVKGRDIPIVHRVIKQHWTRQAGNAVERQFLLTKGDNNPTDDIELYARGQTYLDRQEEIIGLVEGFVPFVGMVTIWMNEIKWIKYSVIGGLGLLAILQREG